ncbi:hypothetical protein [Spirosoma pulveris]
METSGRISRSGSFSELNLEPANKSQSSGVGQASFESVNPQQRSIVKQQRRLRYDKISFFNEVTAQQAHHPNYTNHEGKAISPDDWLFDTKNKYDFFKQFTENRDNLAFKAKLKIVISGWNCSGSIIDSLIELFKEYYDESDELSENDKKIIENLAVLKSNIALRVRDLSTQCLTKLKIKNKTGKNINIDLALDWGDILKQTRFLMKGQLVNDVCNPQTLDKETSIKIVNQAIDLMAMDKIIEEKHSKTAVSLQELYSYGYLKRNPHKVGELEFKMTGNNKFKLFNTSPTFTKKDAGGKLVEVTPEFNFSKGHIRHIILLEWKAVSELLGLAKAYE